MTLASNRAIYGAARQAVKGTLLAATTFPRWETGSSIDPALTEEKIREGDGTVSYSTVIKNLQYWKGKLVHGKARAIDVGFFLRAVFGTLADNQPFNGVTGSTPTLATTLTGVHAIGATSIVVASSAGYAPNDKVQIDVNGGATTAEVFNVATVPDGTHLTIASPGLVYGHLGAAAVNKVVAPFTHTFIPQMTREFYSVFQQYLLGTPEALVAVDAMFHSMTIDGQAGKIIHLDYDFAALGGQSYLTAITPTLDASSAPLIYYGGTFSVDGSLVGSTAPYLKAAKVMYKHPLDESLQTEAVTLADFVSTAREFQIDLDVLFQDMTLFKKTYFNASTIDSAVMGTGALDITWLAGGSDVANSLQILAPATRWTAAPLPSPSLDGKAFVQKVTAIPVVSPEFKAVLKNSQAVPY